MKLGLISDIHADHNSLMAALTLLDRLGVDVAVCCGDIVEKGNDGEKVIHTIRDLEILTVRGNHDEAAVGNQRWVRENFSTENPLASPHFLSDEALKFLTDLPSLVNLRYKGISILLAHGAPWGNQTYVFPNSPRMVLEQVWQAANAEIVILGHTHKPMVIERGSDLIVNPGALCGDLTGCGTCAILALPEREVIFYRVDTGGEYLDAARVKIT
jgi:putative phosphoesterase